jgi:ABC-type phosphate/phosphonate transport system substrate-binding protein
MGRGSLALVAAVLAAVLLAAGCGGDDSSSSSAPISKEEFITKADAVCQRGNKRMETALVGFLTKDKKIQKPNQADNEKFILTVLIPNLKREIKEIQALGVPDGDEEKVEAMIAALEEGLDTAEDNPEVVAAGTSDIVFGIASRLAGEYGLATCGSR